MDAYKTIKSSSEGLYKEKGSKFIAYAHPVSSIEEAKKLNKYYRKEYYDARHHCFAYLIDPEKPTFRAADDGEPSNSAGNPILGQIKSNNLYNVMVMVVRYFGGTKLGVPGLVHAYKSAALDAIRNAVIIDREIEYLIKIDFEYLEMDKVMKIIKKYGLKIANQSMDLTCSYELIVPKKDYSGVVVEIQDTDCKIVED